MEEPSKGSPWKAIGPAGRVFPIPGHNGLKTEIGDECIRGLCRTFGFDLAAFKRDL